MKERAFLLLLSAAAAAAAAEELLRVDGMYAGPGVPLGGTLYLCTASARREVYGVASMSLVLRGLLDQDAITGLWAGPGGVACHRGSFILRHLAGKISGTLVCEISGAVAYTFANATRVSAIPPSALECAHVAGAAADGRALTLHGRWGGTTDSCVERTSGGGAVFAQSGVLREPHYGIGVRLYAEGYCAEDTAVCSGMWYYVLDTDAGTCWQYGTAVHSLLANDTSLMFWWNTGTDMDPAVEPDPMHHGYSVLRRSGPAPLDDCHRFASARAVCLGLTQHSPASAVAVEMVSLLLFVLLLLMMV